MNTLLRTVLRMVLLAAGLWLVSLTAPALTSAASAAPTDTPQLVDLTVDVPVDLCGTTVAVLGDAAPPSVGTPATDDLTPQRSAGSGS